MTAGAAIETASLIISFVAAAECAVGRVGQMDRRLCKPSLMIGYAMASMVCALAVFPAVDWISQPMLRVSSLVIAIHLVVTWADWRHGCPAYALRSDVLTGLEPSRIPADDRR